MSEHIKAERILTRELLAHAGKVVRMMGWCHRIRHLGGISFIVLRDRQGFCQLVQEGQGFSRVNLEDCIEVAGMAREEPKAPGGAEVLVMEMRVLSKALEDPPCR